MINAIDNVVNAISGVLYKPYIVPLFLVLAGVIFSLPIPEFLRDRLRVPAPAMKLVGGAALLGLTFIAVTYIAVGSYNPFIYFNF